MTHGDVTTGYVDSHCHLHDTRGVPAEEVVAAALGAGVVAMIDVGCDAASTESAIGFARQFPGILNGSLIYAPALVLVLLLGIFHWSRALAERRTLLASTGVFVAALFFRTVDSKVCTGFQIGTHFMWHVLAAAALYLAMRALIANLPRGKEAVQVKPTPGPA